MRIPTMERSPKSTVMLVLLAWSIRLKSLRGPGRSGGEVIIRVARG